jgi:hypothetical protein
MKYLSPVGRQTDTGSLSDTPAVKRIPDRKTKQIMQNNLTGVLIMELRKKRHFSMPYQTSWTYHLKILAEVMPDKLYILIFVKGL